MAFGQFDGEDECLLVEVEGSRLVTGGERGGHSVESLGLGPAVTEVAEDAQRGPVVPDGLLVAAGEPVDVADVAECDGLALTVADLKEGGLSLPVADQRLVVTARVL